MLVVQPEAVATTGTGWSALITTHYTYLYVDPDNDDALMAAVEELVSPLRRRFCTVEWSHQGESGWDVYVIELVPVAAPVRPVLNIA